MKPVFVDTSFLIGLALRDDQLHSSAIEWSRRTAKERITTDLVLVELADSLAVPHSRRIALELIEGLRSSPSVQVIHCSEALVDRGLALFRTRPDKSWGLTDCVSFVVMSELGIDEALTADHHFEQAGFRALLRTSTDSA